MAANLQEKIVITGLLDMLANGCLASGTNAWTDQDHTAYTISTVGQQGFLKLLPVYLDHILQPLITESNFITEVHHVNAKGEDAGVVYTEMQEHESKMADIVQRTLRQRLFADTGYAVSFGGRLEPLRTTLNVDKVRAYHRQYYSASNLCLVVTGNIDHKALLAAVCAVETDVMHTGGEATPAGAAARPFSTPINALCASEELVVTCPAEDDTLGEVVVGWHGPKATDQQELAALNVLAEYLEDTAVAPLQRDFVQTDDPLCSDVMVETEGQSVCLLSIHFEGVPVEKLRLVKDKLLSLLKCISNGEEPFDMERLEYIIDKLIFRFKNRMELCPQEIISDLAITDAIYGDETAPFEYNYNFVEFHKNLHGRDQEFWRQLVSRYFTPPKHHVAVIGEPNCDLVDKEAEKEQKRIDDRKTVLGVEGLKRNGERFELAFKENTSNVVPESIFKEFTIDSLKDISFVDVKEFSSLNGYSRHPTFSSEGLSYELMLHDSKTNFVELCALLDTTALPAELRPYLMLWRELLFESPMVSPDGERIAHDDVIRRFSHDLVEYFSTAGPFPRFVNITLIVPASRFAKGASWLRKFLYDVQFCADRVKVVTKRLANSVAESKQEGEEMSRFLMEHMTFEHDSNTYVNNVVRLEKFLKKLTKRCDSEPEKVESELKRLSALITAPECLTVKLLCNVDGVGAATVPVGPSPGLVWSTTFEPPPTVGDCGEELKCRTVFDREPSYVRRDAFGQGLILSVGSCEANHMYQVCQSLDDWSAAAPLLVFVQYVCQPEGPLWRSIRGSGLAYDASISVDIDKALITLNLYRSAQLATAYTQTKQTIENILNEVEVLNDKEFSAAKRSLIYEIVKSEETVSKTSSQMLLARFRKQPSDFNRRFCDAVFAVNEQDALKMAKKYIPALFDPKLTNTSVVCHPTKRKSLIKEFKSLGKELRVVKLDDAELSYP